MLTHLRPVLLLVFYVLVLWLASRVLRQALLGRVGQVGRFLLFGAAVAVYVLSTVFAALGAAGSLPWMPALNIVATAPLRTVTFALIVFAAAWLLVREVVRPLPHWLGFILDHPLRRLLAPADAVLDRMALGPGMRVLEVGCGTGFLTGEVARRITPGGVLFTIDVQPGMVERTRRRVEREGLDNIELFAAPAGKLPFDIFDVDLVFMAQVLGEVSDRRAVLREAERVLRPGGVLSVSETIIDPHYRTRNDVTRLARQAGFEPESVQGSLFAYTATFTKPRSKEPMGHVRRPGI